MPGEAGQRSLTIVFMIQTVVGVIFTLIFTFKGVATAKPGARASI